RSKLGVVSDEGAQEVLGPLERQGIQPKPSVVALADPPVLVLGTVVDQEKYPRRREALHEAVENRLRLRVDPVKILEHEEQRLSLALTNQEPLDGIDGALTALRRIESAPQAVVNRHIKQREERGRGRREGLIERAELVGDFFPNLVVVVPILDREIRLEKV